MRTVAAVALAAGLLAFAPPAEAADKAAINAAIKKGGEFLRARYAQGVAVDPGVGGGGEYGLGAVALGGLGLLEAGVKPDDEAVRNVAAAVRKGALSQTGTYHIALCVLFLDRLADRGDVPLLQMLGVRLYAGMNGNGGWTYQCWQNTQDAEGLLKALQTNELTTARPKADPKNPKDDGFLKPDAALKTGGLHPEVAKVHAAVVQAIKSTGRGGGAGGGDDNSNTQFGIVGLWVAARHGVPAKDAFALIEARFVQTQGRDGGWGYTAAGGGQSTPAMTCAGLLGLAVGRAGREAGAEKKEPKKGLPEDDPFFNPKKGDGEKADKLAQPKGDGGMQKSAEVGLKVLAAFVAAQQQGRGQNPLQNFVGAGNSLYTLWSLERVGVGYGLDTLGGVDWYDWGATIILGMQQADGSFTDSSYQADVNTAFALLFLAKSNFTKELGHKKAQDPGKGELRGGGAAPLHAPPPKEPRKQGGPPPGADPDLTPGGFSLPKVVEPTEAGEADKVAKALLAATDADWPTKLAEARDTKGAKWTRGLVLALSKMDGDRRHQGREALAERLVRMTPRTLREMLKDPEIELRRAACLACGMRDEKAFAPALIERLNDPADYVARAARASLKSLTGNTVDFGPVNTADDDARLKAVNQWAAWFEQNK
jgi:hypothetical protein